MQRLLAPAAVLLAVAAVWLLFDNPEIDGTSRGDDYTCLAPWDTVLNDANNVPGSEPPPDGEEIGARCTTAGHDRFDAAVLSGVAAVVLSLLAGGSVRRGTREPEALNAERPPS